MRRKAVQIGPLLEAMMDERDHLLIKLSMAQDSPAPSFDVESIQCRLAHLGSEIAKIWGKSDA